MADTFADPGTETEKPAIHVVRIWKDHEPIDDKGNYREVEWVEWAKKGTNGATTLDKVSRLKAVKDDRRNPVWKGPEIDLAQGVRKPVPSCVRVTTADNPSAYRTSSGLSIKDLPQNVGEICVGGLDGMGVDPEGH